MSENTEKPKKVAKKEQVLPNTVTVSVEEYEKLKQKAATKSSKVKIGGCRTRALKFLGEK